MTGSPENQPFVERVEQVRVGDNDQSLESIIDREDIGMNDCIPTRDPALATHSGRWCAETWFRKAAIDGDETGVR